MALFHGDLGFNAEKPCSSSVFLLPVDDYLNTTKESLLMKMAWEMMNPEYKKGMQKKPTAVKKKDPISKTAAPPSKKTSATTNLSNAESEKKKQSSEEECLLEPEGSEENAPEEDKPVWNKDYSIEEAYRGEDEFYGGADLEYENQDEAEYNEDIIR
ncbi:hypothetical protein DY000_02008665 [Brassica cretica]|uniref:Brf1 TBP-binding domain-containing protein n=1 Tax=Brassica cretica TaxID=69181 RepID=A0ABQ7C7W0_BRACR|nr:hypothetical protein DY000_02008665 [Brassica cretica]